MNKMRLKVILNRNKARAPSPLFEEYFILQRQVIRGHPKLTLRLSMGGGQRLCDDSTDVLVLISVTMGEGCRKLSKIVNQN